MATVSEPLKHQVVSSKLLDGYNIRTNSGLVPYNTCQCFPHLSASNPIKTKKKIHTSSVMGEQSELPHWSISQRQLPLFMLPDKDCSESCKFFNLSDNKLYNIQIPEFHGKWCCGSSKGWLLTVDNNSNIQLLNPLSRTQIQLPSFDKFKYPQVIYEPEIRRGHRYMRKAFFIGRSYFNIGLYCCHLRHFNDGYEQGIDNGIYNLEDDSIKPFYPNSSSWITNPIWLLPNLW
ncbi:uncharacterized protein LOC143849679 isoform X2 [Tasmannia lanceolata]|uniref:uncharacterized protein LOC143849679 isoform X2 n=1 Tax=Tasmannia lanceolata TaxID=3420 RepID=UPI004064628E